MNVNKKTETKCLVFLVVLLFSTTKIITAQNVESHNNMRKTFEYGIRATKSLRPHTWMSYQVSKEYRKNEKTQWKYNYDVILNYNKKNPLIFIHDNDGYKNTSFCLTKDRIEIVNGYSYELTIFQNKHKKSDMYSFYGLADYVPHYFKHLLYYIVPMQNKINVMMLTLQKISNSERIIMNGTPYIEYSGFLYDRYGYNTKTEKYDIPEYDKIVSFVIEESGILDSVYCHTYPDTIDKSEIFYSISNIDFSNKQDFLDSIFDFNNQRYDKYSRHDDLNPPPSRAGSYNKKINDAILDFPLLSLDGTTTKIRDKNGWVLLNLWSATCVPCIKHLQEMGNEKDSLGCYSLEKSGISVLAINYNSNNMELIKKIADKTKTNDIIYSAKGLQPEINIHSLGYYYLLSPNRETVYESGYIENYSELLQAKKDYENKHNKP